MTCSHCLDASDLFDRRTARRELRSYKKRGPTRSTRLLLNAIREAAPARFTLLDIGSGVGAIPDALSDRTVSGTVVDASAAYLEVAGDYAKEKGFHDRMTYIHGDVVDCEGALSQHDVVTLDRVVCCYPELDALVGAATATSKTTIGLVLPRVHLLTRIGVPLLNLLLRLKRSNFRVYLHSPESINSSIERAGFSPVAKDQTLMWQSWVFAKP